MSTLVHELLCWTTANRSYQCHWEATAVPSSAPSTAPSSSNRRPAYPRQAHTDTLSNHTHVCLLEPRLFKDIRGILTWSHDSVGNCGMHLPLQSRAEAGAGAHICSCHTNTTCARIALTVSAAEDPLGLTLNFHDLCSGREAGWNTTITLFLLKIILFLLLAFSVTWYLTVTLFQGKNVSIFWRWPKSLLYFLRKKCYQCGCQHLSVPFRV